jgi:hypothetical protein
VHCLFVRTGSLPWPVAKQGLFERIVLWFRASESSHEQHQGLRLLHVQSLVSVVGAGAGLESSRTVHHPEGLVSQNYFGQGAWLCQKKTVTCLAFSARFHQAFSAIRVNGFRKPASAPFPRIAPASSLPDASLGKLKDFSQPLSLLLTRPSSWCSFLQRQTPSTVRRFDSNCAQRLGASSVRVISLVAFPTSKVTKKFCRHQVRQETRMLSAPCYHTLFSGRADKCFIFLKSQQKSVNVRNCP